MMRSWKSWIGIAVSALFLYIAFHNIDWKDFYRSLITVKLWPNILVMAIVVGMLFLRGYRWTFFLKPVKRVSPVTLFWSTTIGFALNNILPARLGEVARAYSANRQTQVPFGTTFGTIVVERLYDIFAALFLFIVTLFAVDFPNFEKVFGVTQGKVATVFGGLGAGLIVFIFLLKWKTEFAIRIMRFFLKPFPDRFSDKFIGFFRSFVDGLTQTTKPADIIWIIFLSLAMWVISTFSVYLNVYSFGESLSPDAVIILMMSIIIAVAIPAAPGYAGTYHSLAQAALTMYVGIDKSVALSIAVVLHASNYIPQTIVGLLRFAYEGIKIGELKDMQDKAK